METTTPPEKETQAEKAKRIKAAQAELKKEKEKKKKIFADLVKERIRVTKILEKAKENAKENADTISIAQKTANDARQIAEEIEIVLQRTERLESGEDKKGMAAHLAIMQKIK